MPIPRHNAPLIRVGARVKGHRRKKVAHKKTSVTPLRIRELRKAKGLTLEQLAAAIGSDPINISRLERGMQGYTDRTLRAIAKELGVKVIELFSDGELDEHKQPGDVRFRKVPVVEIVSGTSEGELSSIKDETYEGPTSVLFPTKHATAYALRVRGDGLRPRVKSGEYVIVEPGVTAANGDDVVVKLKNGRRLLRQLLYTRTSEVAFGSVNESSPTITLSANEIEAIHFVAGIVQRAS